MSEQSFKRYPEWRQHLSARLVRRQIAVGISCGIIAPLSVVSAVFARKDSLAVSLVFCGIGAMLLTISLQSWLSVSLHARSQKDSPRIIRGSSGAAEVVIDGCPSRIRWFLASGVLASVLMTLASFVLFVDGSTGSDFGVVLSYWWIVGIPMSFLIAYSLARVPRSTITISGRGVECLMSRSLPLRTREIVFVPWDSLQDVQSRYAIENSVASTAGVDLVRHPDDPRVIIRTKFGAVTRYESGSLWLNLSQLVTNVNVAISIISAYYDHSRSGEGISLPVLQEMMRVPPLRMQLSCTGDNQAGGGVKVSRE